MKPALDSALPCARAGLGCIVRIRDLRFYLLLAWLFGQNWAARAQLAHGIDPANLGKGDWIWEMSACQTALGLGSPQAVLNYEAAKGMQWLTVKGADGGDTASWSQFNS